MIDVIVVGAGIVGAACAYEMAQHGAAVEVIDESFPGGGATGAGMGHLVALENDPLSAYSVALWHQLELPAEAEFWNCGTLWIAEEEDQLHGREDGELLDSKQLYEAEPNLRPGLAGGVLIKGDAVVYAPVATRWLLAQSKAKITRASVSNLNNIKAGAVIVATGASAPKLVPELPIRPRKGYLAITDRYPGFLRHQVVELGYMQSAHGEADESVAFNVQPRPTGQLLIGSSRTYGDNPELLPRMLNRAFHFMPGLRDCHIIRTWTGFRASTPDKQPIMGRLRDNIFLAVGHEGLGVTTSLGTAKILASEILGRPSPIAKNTYFLERFCAKNAHK